MIPKEIKIIDSIPKNENGKFNRKVLYKKYIDK
jgi:acyl-CoA synthetase (AMP-forming)/AMP-acid ligase II